MQFKVPQNIDMADRIIGSLTLVQFLYILVGGLVVYFLFTTLGSVNITLFIGTAFPVALFSLALAFLKIQDQPFPKFVGAFFVYLFRPKVRIWFKDGMLPELIITPDVKSQKEDAPEPKKIKKSQLEKLITVMDTGGRPAQDGLANQPKRVSVSPSFKADLKGHKK